MADTRRRTAADARRITNRANDGRADTEEIRALLRRTHKRGVDEGRSQMQQELDGLDVRTTLLEVGADHLDSLAARVSGIPNNSRTMQAFREAAAVLRDARKLGELPADADEEPARTKAVKARKAKSKSTAKAKGKKGG